MEYFVQIALGVIAGLFAVIGILLGWWIKSEGENNRIRMENMHNRANGIDTRLANHAEHIGRLFSKANDLEVQLSANHYTKPEIRDAITTVANNAVSILSAQMSSIQRQIDDLRKTMFAGGAREED